MIEAATGVVLRTLPLTETSVIARWLTRDLGRLSTVAKGGRRPSSPFAGKLDLFVEADFTFNRSQRSDLHVLREVSVNQYHLPLRTDIGRLQAAAYCTALLEHTTETETPLPGLFQLFCDLLAQLSVSGARPRLVFAFELKLLDALGLFPALEQTRLKPATRELIALLARGSWPTIQQLRPPAAPVRQLGTFLKGFLAHHLGTIPPLRQEATKAAPTSRGGSPA